MAAGPRCAVSSSTCFLLRPLAVKLAPSRPPDRIHAGRLDWIGDHGTGEPVGRLHRFEDGEVQPVDAYRRDDVGGVADKQQAWLAPRVGAGDPIEQKAGAG